MEYTRLDQIIDVMFTTATDVQPAMSAEGDLPTASDDKGPLITTVDSESTKEVEKGLSKGTCEFTDSRLLQEKREDILQSVGQKVGAALIKKSKALYWAPLILTVLRARFQNDIQSKGHIIVGMPFTRNGTNSYGKEKLAYLSLDVWINHLLFVFRGAFLIRYCRI
jgi:hypothetical protein